MCTHIIKSSHILMTQSHSCNRTHNIKYLFYIFLRSTTQNVQLKLPTTFILIFQDVLYWQSPVSRCRILKNKGQTKKPTNKPKHFQA